MGFKKRPPREPRRSEPTADDYMLVGPGMRIREAEDGFIDVETYFDDDARLRADFEEWGPIIFDAWTNEDRQWVRTVVPTALRRLALSWQITQMSDEIQARRNFEVALDQLSRLDRDTALVLLDEWLDASIQVGVLPPHLADYAYNDPTFTTEEILDAIQEADEVTISPESARARRHQARQRIRAWSAARGRALAAQSNVSPPDNAAVIEAPFRRIPMSKRRKNHSKRQPEKINCLRCWKPAIYRDPPGDNPIAPHLTPAGLPCAPEVGWHYLGPKGEKLLCVGADPDDPTRRALAKGKKQVWMPMTELIAWQEEKELPLERIADMVISAFSEITPDWAPPQLAMYYVARSLGLPVLTVDEEDEEAFLANWQRDFEDLDLNEEEIELWTPSGSIFFNWVDCRELEIDDIPELPAHWKGLARESDYHRPGCFHVLRVADMVVVGHVRLDKRNDSYYWVRADGRRSEAVFEDDYDAFDDYCRQFNAPRAQARAAVR